MDTPDITLKVCQALKAATLLPAVKSGDSVHQCIETIEQTYSSKSSLPDETLTVLRANGLLMGVVLQRGELKRRSMTELV